MRALVLAVLVAAPAFSLAHDIPRVPPNPAYQSECGSCHVAYPPRLLPAQSWDRLLSGLRRHFGTDASVDEPTRRSLAAFLTEHAGRRAAPPGEEPRITQTAWFLKEHRKADMKNPADCGACHRQLKGQ